MVKRFTIFIILLIVFLASIVISSIMPFPNLAPRVFTTCITPPAYPQLITQSGTICGGNYNYGIGIGANNIKIVCSQGTNFKGINWNGSNGLTIQGRRNITVEGCSFNSFNQNGIYVGNVTPYTSEINLIKINSSSNNENGMFVGHNIVNLHVNNSKITNNHLDGVVFRANHVGPVTATSTVFPRGITLSNNIIINNSENGIYFDSHDYYDYFLTTPYGYIIRLNNSISVENNSIQNNGKNGIKISNFDIGRSSFYNIDARVIGNRIIANGFQLNGSGIEISVNKSNRIINDPNTSNSAYGFDYIYLNDITGNALDGISFTVPDLDNTSSSLDSGEIFANYITENTRRGISVDFEESTSYHLEASMEILQNSINNNGKEGIYLVGNGFDKSVVSAFVLCNDILSNGVFTAGRDNGIEVNKFDMAITSIGEKNIIERNLAGISITRIGYSVNSIIGIGSNYIGLNNTIGIYLNDTSNATGIGRNDLDQNYVQAIEFGSTNNTFLNNWWSDYSPSCVDSNPTDGWCDIPRPVPHINQDIQPKAGNWWGHKQRGYHLRANPGIILEQSCTIPILPSPPNITVPNFGEFAQTQPVTPEI